jgi:hypothetical protein
MRDCGLTTLYTTLGTYLLQNVSSVLVRPHGVGIFGNNVAISLTSTGAGATGAGATASDKALGYCYGGRPTNATETTILSTMIVYDI